MLNVLKKNVGIYGANTYILYGDKREAVVIDCGGDALDIMHIITINNLKCVAILLTHGHFDHIGGINELRELTGAPVYGSIDEKDLFLNAQNNLSETTLLGPVIVECDHYFKDGDLLDFGDVKLNVMSTPGHTEGSVIFYNNEQIFSGDTIFKGSIGRTDLYSGNQVKMNDSLKKIKNFFDGNEIVYPGHGAESTMATEKKTNPYIAGII